MHALCCRVTSSLQIDGTDKIYICGGSNGQIDLDTCMKFDMQTGAWSDISNMSMARSCPGNNHINIYL